MQGFVLARPLLAEFCTCLGSSLLTELYHIDFLFFVLFCLITLSLLANVRELSLLTKIISNVLYIVEGRIQICLTIGINKFSILLYGHSEFIVHIL